MKRALFPIFALALYFGALSVQADRIRSTTIACPDVETLETLENMEGDFKDKNLFLMQKGCVVLTPKDKIHVLAPDKSCCGIYARVQIDKTGEIMYIRKLDIYIEQSGTGNIFKF